MIGRLENGEYLKDYLEEKKTLFDNIESRFKKQNEKVNGFEIQSQVNRGNDSFIIKVFYNKKKKSYSSEVISLYTFFTFQFFEKSIKVNNSGMKERISSHEYINVESSVATYLVDVDENGKTIFTGQNQSVFYSLDEIIEKTLTKTCVKFEVALKKEFSVV